MKRKRVKKQVLIDDRYKILKKLGSGAMGDVYKVRDLKDKKIIALKILSRGKTSSETVQRFKREFKLLAGLHHPNLCSVYDFGILKDGRSYFTIEYIDGKDIFKVSKGLSYKRIYPWIVQLCRVLEYIHSKGLIHYDIKPGNVLMAKGKEQGAESKKPYAQSPVPCVKLMDFGLAGEQRIKGGVIVRGTFPYIAPEVIKGLAVDHRADLYSLGVLLYEVITQKLFQEGRESFTTLIKQRIDRVFEPPSKIVPDMPKRLERLILRLLAFEPSSRYSRSNEIIKEINKIQGLKFELETEKTLEGYLLSSRFVGRDKEMDLLKSLYAKARQGEGKVVVVIGEAGIGKTRLLKEFKVFSQLRRGHCFIGYANKDQTSPLEPFYDIFSEIVKYIGDESARFRSRKNKLSLAVLFKVFPDLTIRRLKKSLPKLVPLGPKQEQLRTFEALTELVGYCAEDLGELVILLEDLHWADDLSIQFLKYLGRNLEGKNILICGTTRRQELKENQTLMKMITNSRKGGFLTMVELKPFKFRSLYSFLDSTITPGSNSSKLTRYLMEKTGGNPFFVEEIMRTLLRRRKVSIGERLDIGQFQEISLPETIKDVVLQRIKDLDRASQEVVKFGAILLKDFSYDLMKHLTRLDDSELSRVLWGLKRKQVLIEENNRYRFYHATLREAVTKNLGQREERRVNYQIGKTLENIHKKNPGKIIEDLAYYYINARDRKKGIAFGLRAAKKSIERYANEQAIKFYKGVLSFLQNEDSRRRFDILQKIAQVEYLVDYYDDSIKHYKQVLAMKIGAINKKVQICIRMGTVYSRKGEQNKVLYILQKAKRLIKKGRKDRFRSLLETIIDVMIRRTYLYLGDYRKASKFDSDVLRKFKKGIKKEEEIRLLGSIYYNLGTIESHKGEYGKTDYNKAISYYNEANKYYKKIKDENSIIMLMVNLGTNYKLAYNWHKAYHCYKKVIQISEKVGSQLGLSLGHLALGDILFEKGYYRDALDHYQRTFSISKQIGNRLRISSALMGIGGCFFELCNYGKAKNYIEQALKISNTIGWEDGSVYAIMVIGNIYQSIGDFTSALRFYRKALRISKNSGSQRNIAYSLSCLSSLFMDVGEVSRVKRYVSDAMKFATALELQDIMIESFTVLCRVNVMKKDYTIAAKYCKKGIKMATELRAKKSSLRLLLFLSEIYYHERKYLKGVNIANQAIKMAKDMGTKDLHAEALLNKAKNGIKQGVLSRLEVYKILSEAKKNAEEIGCPEVLWKVYFEYGRFLQEDKEYIDALDYYKMCNEVFEDVISNIKNESYRKSYLNRPDRKAIFAATNEIENLF